MISPLCRHTTLLWEEGWVRDDPRKDCKGDYHCQGNGLLFRFISILGILTQSSSQIKKPKSVLKLRRWISIKNYNPVFFWISFFFVLVGNWKKRICIPLIFFFFLLIKPGRAGRCSQQHSDFPLAYIPNSLTLPPSQKKTRKKERKERRKEGRKGNSRTDISGLISVIGFHVKSKSKSRFPNGKHP